MCQALLLAYRITKDKRYLDIALESFDFLLEVCQIDGIPAPIGQAGWYRKGDTKADYDQQAVDVGKMVTTALLAYRITENKKYLKQTIRWFNWFHKGNTIKAEMIDSETGGCYDGVSADGINPNMGAESVLVYLMAYLDFSVTAKNLNDNKKEAMKGKL
jgi:hypothetical protein